MIRIASNRDIESSIVEAAESSFTGNMLYTKKDKKGRVTQKKRYVVVPIDCGYTSRGNAVLFAQDYNDNKQIKQFIISQIDRFEVVKRNVKTSFPIQVENLKKMFHIK